MFKNYVPAVVSGLLLRSRPFAIAWLVISVVVFAVNLQPALIAWLHVGNEIGNVFPSFADGDTSPSVAWVFFVLLVIAATHHCTPYLAQRIVPSPMLGNDLLMKAAAALRFATCKAVRPAVTGRASAGALHAGIKVAGIGEVSENTKHGVPPKGCPDRDGFRFNFNHLALQ